MLLANWELTVIQTENFTTVVVMYSEIVYERVRSWCRPDKAPSSWNRLHNWKSICVSDCSGLNFQDLMVRQGAIDSPPKTPFTMGFECAGEVEEIGEGVTDFKVRLCHCSSHPASPYVTGGPVRFSEVLWDVVCYETGIRCLNTFTSVSRSGP